MFADGITQSSFFITPSLFLFRYLPFFYSIINFFRHYNPLFWLDTLQENTERCKQLCTPDTNPCRLHSYDRFKHRFLIIYYFIIIVFFPFFYVFLSLYLDRNNILRSEEEIKTIRSHKQINYIASMMKEQPQSPEERVLDPNELILTVALYHPSKALKQQTPHPGQNYRKYRSYISLCVIWCRLRNN